MSLILVWSLATLTRAFSRRFVPGVFFASWR